MMTTDSVGTVEPWKCLESRVLDWRTERLWVVGGPCTLRVGKDSIAVRMGSGVDVNNIVAMSSGGQMETGAREGGG